MTFQKFIFTFAAALFLASCRNGQQSFFSDEELLDLDFPQIPQEKSEIFSPSEWRLSYFDSGGDLKTETFMPNCGGTSIVVQKNVFNPILLEGICGGTKMTMRPAGAIYPHDFADGADISWPGGFSATLARKLLSASECGSDTSKDYLARFNWRKFNAAVAAAENPWRDFDMDKALKNIAARKIYSTFYLPTKDETKKRSSTVSIDVSDDVFSDYVPEPAFCDKSSIPVLLFEGAQNNFWTKSEIFCVRNSLNVSKTLEIISHPRYNPENAATQ